MIQRAVVITEIIAPYRIPVFNALAQQKGLDLHVIFLSETDASLRQWRVSKDEIRFSYEVLPSWHFRAAGQNILLNRGLWSSLNRVSPGSVICGGYNYVASWEAQLWARRRGAAFVLWSESNAQDQRRGYAGVEFLKSYFLKRCDGFVVPGKASFEYLQTFGFPASSMFVAPNAIDNCFFQREAENARRKGAALREKLNLPPRFILFVGRLVPEKGVFDLIEAYAKLEPELRSAVGLVFAGDGVSRAALMERAKRITPGAVCCPGFAQREDLARLYALSEALVLPTHSDPWGLVVNEAMACGLPIIVTSVAGCAADLVEDGWNGSVVPAGDSGRLSLAMSSLLRQPEGRKRMAACSSERIQEYSPEACAQGLAAAALARRTSTP